MNRKIGIGIIGAGWIGREHARNLALHPNVEIVAIADSQVDKARMLQTELSPAAQVESDYQKLLTDARIEGVYICTPNASHAEIAIAAAQAGKHIMCEKPMAITLADCEKVHAAVKAQNVKYLIGYHRRFNPLYQYAMDLLTQGRLGDPVLIESDYLHHIPGDLAIWDWLGKEQVAGSLFHGGAGHSVDLLRYFGGEITEVTCFKDIRMPRKTQIETEDVAVATFRFANGALGKVMLLVGGIHPFFFNFALWGTRGTVRDNRVWLDTIPRFDQPGHENDCIELPRSWIPDNIPGNVSETWGKLDAHFIDMILNGAPSINDSESALRTSRVVFAVLQAAATRQTIHLDD